jgi:hypothetical protein
MAFGFINQPTLNAYQFYFLLDGRRSCYFHFPLSNITSSLSEQSEFVLFLCFPLLNMLLCLVSNVGGFGSRSYWMVANVTLFDSDGTGETPSVEMIT